MGGADRGPEWGPRASAQGGRAAAPGKALVGPRRGGQAPGPGAGRCHRRRRHFSGPGPGSQAGATRPDAPPRPVPAWVAGPGSGWPRRDLRPRRLPAAPHEHARPPYRSAQARPSPPPRPLSEAPEPGSPAPGPPRARPRRCSGEGRPGGGPARVCTCRVPPARAPLGGLRPRTSDALGPNLCDTASSSRPQATPLCASVPS